MSMIGQITLFAGNYAPRGWKFCDGGQLGTWDYTAVYAIVAATQGENWGNDTFYLPTIPDVDNCKYIICIDGDYPGRP